MECALCKNTILMEVHGFAQLACKHTFHLRCMVPSCNQFWGNGPIGCKICGSDPVVPANAAGAEVEIPNNEQAAVLGQQLNVTFDDAYRIASDIEEKQYEQKLAEHIKTLTPSQKVDLKMYVKSCRLGKKLRSTVRVELNKRTKEFIQKNNHLIIVFNKLYRQFVKEFTETNLCKLHWKTYQKNIRLYNKLTNGVTNNEKYHIEDICKALKYSRVPVFFGRETPMKRYVRYRFYKVTDMLFDVKNLDKPKY
jgi:hypothetical protein